MQHVIETNALTHIYGAEPVLDSIDWKVESGSAVALLGRNGTGKTTLLKLLMGFMTPTRGSCSVLGEDAFGLSVAGRQRLGYVPESTLLPPWATAGELAEYHSTIYPRWDAKLEAELFDLFELGRRQKVETLSKGQRRRLMILLALCQNADLLLLDEPASGLDVGVRREFLSLLGNFLAQGDKSLVFSTHIVTDVERVASHVAILDDAVFKQYRPVTELQQETRCVSVPWDRAAELNALCDSKQILESFEDGGTSTLTLARFDSELEARIRGQFGASVEIESLTLEDIFLAFVEGERATDEAL